MDVERARSPLREDVAHLLRARRRGDRGDDHHRREAQHRVGSVAIESAFHPLPLHERDVTDTPGGERESGDPAGAIAHGRELRRPGRALKRSGPDQAEDDRRVVPHLERHALGAGNDAIGGLELLAVVRCRPSPDRARAAPEAALEVRTAHCRRPARPPTCDRPRITRPPCCASRAVLAVRVVAQRHDGQLLRGHAQEHGPVAGERAAMSPRSAGRDRCSATTPSRSRWRSHGRRPGCRASAMRDSRGANSGRSNAVAHRNMSSTDEYMPPSPTTSSRLFAIRHVVVSPDVANGAVGDRCGVVMLKTGASHVERREDPLPGEVIERPSRHTLNDDRQQDVSGVAVEMIGARGEVELRLSRQHLEHAAVGNHVSPMSVRPATTASDNHADRSCDGATAGS